MKPDIKYFNILGLDFSATKEEIKQAYRNQIKKWHPDKFAKDPKKLSEATEKSKLIIEAFAALENYETKFSYETTKTHTDNPKQNSKAGNFNSEEILVQSSNIYSISYDEEKQILKIRFRGGARYAYFNVEKSVFEGLISAKSKGKFAHSYIYPIYRYKQI